MSSRSNENTRRTFSFPAIRPSESVSSTTLIASLLALARTITSYKTRAILVNERNVTHCIRLVDGFLLFLQEIPLTGLDVCNSVLLSFSELHFIFQKIQFLLEDCTKEDARLWGLTKSEFVASEFNALMRGFGVVLDVLPLEGLNIDQEIQEILELVKKQAMKIQFREQWEDQKNLRLVFSILYQFECGISPEPNDLRRVLDYLCIRSWNDCNKEVKFLEDEIGLESQTPDKKYVQLLTSLIGLMLYCRCTLFDVVNQDVLNQNDSDLVNQRLRCLNIDDFRCPITLEIMNDPVTISTGHTYDRASILKWFRASCPTCPKTGEKLISTDFVPNLALKQLIRHYCTELSIPFTVSERKSRDVSRIIFEDSVVGEKAVELLAKFLVCKLQTGSNEEQIKAAYEIRLITKTSVFSRSCFVEAGAIPTLLNLLASKDPSAEENAAASLLNLSKFSGSRCIIPENGGLRLIVNVLQEGQRMEARQYAAGTLFYLASVEKNRVMIGQIQDCILALVELVRNGTNRAKKNSLITIFGLLVYPGNHSIVLTTRIVPLLINMLRSCDTDDNTTDVLAVLSSLADKPIGAIEIISSGAFPIVNEILGSSNSRTAREYCVSLLLSVCIHGGKDVVSVLAKSTSLMAALYSELAIGNSRASKKASSLIKIIHNFTERSFGFSTPNLPHERFVHVL